MTELRTTLSEMQRLICSLICFDVLNENKCLTDCVNDSTKIGNGLEESL